MTLNSKKKLVIYSGAPISYENSVKSYGFHKLSKKKFSISFVESAEIFHKKKALEEFRKISKKSDRFKADVRLKNKLEFKNFFKNLNKKSIVIVINRGPLNLPSFRKNFDIAYFNFLKLKYISFNFLHWSIKCNFKKSLFLNICKLFWNFLINILIKIKNKNNKPFLKVGSGNMFIKNMKNEKNIINCSSSYINFDKKKQQKRNIIYVDEGVTQSRDKILYNILSKKIGDGKIFLKDLNQLFNFLEKKFKLKVTIAASNKYEYKKNPFGGRKIVYGKTNQLINNAKFILGHSSSALYQALLTKSPVFILKHKEFGLKRNILIDLFASNIFNQKSIFIEKIISKKKLRIYNDKMFRYKILREYFISDKLDYKNFIFYFEKGLKQFA